VSPLLRAGVLGLVVAALGGVLALKHLRPGEASSPQSALAATPQASEPAQALPRLVDLGAGACIPCKKMKPILDELRVTYAARFEVVFIDVWEHPEEAEPYGIQLIPTQIFYAPDGEELFRHEGFFSREDILAKWAELGFRWDEPAAAG
jgi:thioredoxin 1